MASESTTVKKHTCDRCGEFIERESSLNWYPADWQHIQLGQTGATLDLCSACNVELLHFLQERGALDMDLACFRSEGVL